MDPSLGGSEGAASSQLRDAAFVQTLMWISVFSCFFTFFFPLSSSDEKSIWGKKKYLDIYLTGSRAGRVLKDLLWYGVVHVRTYETSAQRVRLRDASILSSRAPSCVTSPKGWNVGAHP